MTTETKAPVKNKVERHGVARWIDHCPLSAGLMELRCGLAILEIETRTKRGVVCTCYRVQSFHDPKSQRLVGFVLVKLDARFQDTDEIHHIDASFGPIPEKHWGCDCADRTYRGPNHVCKHLASVAAALRKIGVLEDLLKGRLANVARPAAPTVCADLEAI